MEKCFLERDEENIHKLLDRKERARHSDLVLAAQVRSGHVPPARALRKVSGYSPVYEAAMKVQLAAKDYKAAAQTLKIANERRFRLSVLSEIPARIVDGFLTAADVDGAAGFVNGLGSPEMRAPLYGRIAAQRSDVGDRQGFKTFIAKAVASAAQLVDLPAGSSFLSDTQRSVVLGRLALVQAAAKDFDGAKETIAIITNPHARRKYETEVLAREFVAQGRLEDARTWVASMDSAEDRAQACWTVAIQLMPIHSEVAR